MLPRTEAAQDAVKVFFNSIFRTCFVGHLKVCFDNMIPICQYKRSALLAIVWSRKIHRFSSCALHPSPCVAVSSFFTHYIAPNVGELDFFQYMNFVYLPAASRLPVHC